MNNFINLIYAILKFNSKNYIKKGMCTREKCVLIKNLCNFGVQLQNCIDSICF